MQLSQILSQTKSAFQITQNSALLDKIKISDIAIDSRLAKANSVFFALKGKNQNGENFILDAIKNGAVVIVAADFSSLKITDKNVILIKAENVFSLLVEFLSNFYSPLPSNIYAITGTNGKTSVAEFTRQILELLGKKSAAIGTLGVTCDHQIKDLENSSLTTPDIVSLYKNLKILKENAIDDVALEVSSIGLEQGRVDGLEISVGAFTNFTQDHLDYHKSMAEYFGSKMILFEKVLSEKSFAVLNSDIKEFSEIKKICQSKDHQIIDYGFDAEFLKITAINQLDSEQEIAFEKRGKKFNFTLKANGEFQAYNVLCALGNVLAKYELDDEELEKLLAKFSSLHLAKGRMELVANLSNNAQVFIDFAHSPDALENLLKLARKITKGRLIILFGCGGDRDAKKRPLMGKIASDLADLVIVTDDNPRSENAAKIRSEIIAACDQEKTIEIDGRKIAIEKAITMLEDGDILILAGKGHEKYQIIGDKKIEFDEELIARNAIRNLS